mgnify:CR=1 FL=1
MGKWTRRAFIGTGALVGGGDVQSFTLSPSRVVYLADQDTDQVVELYSAPVDGSASASRLSPSLAPGEVCNGFELTLDGARAVFVLLGPAQRRLFVAPVDGSAPATLVFSSGLLGPFHFRLGPDGAHLALLASLNVPGRDELYSLALEAASAPVRLNARLAPGGDVQGLPLFSADGSELVYFADGDVDDVLELYATSSDGLGPVRKLNGALVECGEVAPGAAQVFDAPGGARALFVADAERDEVFELYAAPLDGLAPPRRHEREAAGEAKSGTRRPCTAQKEEDRSAEAASGLSTPDGGSWPA